MTDLFTDWPLVESDIASWYDWANQENVAMAKDTKVLYPKDEVIVEAPGVQIVPLEAGSFEIVPPAPPQNAPPTEAQQAWMRNNPRYVRMSHGLSLATYIEQGTLRADGAFIPAIWMPVHDGNGDFGVGIPTRR